MRASGSQRSERVINIITKSARDTQAGWYPAEAAPRSADLGASAMEGNSGECYYRCGKYFARNDSKRRDGTTADDAWDMGRGGFRVDWDASDRNLLTLQGDLYAGNLDQTITQFSPAPPYFPFTAPYQLPVSGGNVLGRWTHEVSSESNLRVQAYYDRTRSDYAILNEDRDTIDLDLQHRFPVGPAGHRLGRGLPRDLRRD